MAPPPLGSLAAAGDAAIEQRFAAATAVQGR
jgi:hypothetical protein